MENLQIHKHEEDRQTCPIIICDAEAGTCHIEGLSFMENSGHFYKPVMAWIYEFIEQNNTPFHLQVKVSYMNSSSSKIFFDLFAKLKKYQDEGKSISAEWHYAYYDEEIEEDIDDIIYESQFEIKKVPFS